MVLSNPRPTPEEDASELCVVLAKDTCLEANSRFLVSTRILDRQGATVQSRLPTLSVVESIPDFIERTGLLVAYGIVDATSGMVPVQLMCLGGPT